MKKVKSSIVCDDINQRKYVRRVERWRRRRSDAQFCISNNQNIVLLISTFLSFSLLLLLLKKKEKMRLMGVCVYIWRGGGDESNRCRAWPLRKRSSYQSVPVCFVDVDVKLKKDQRDAFWPTDTRLSLNIVVDYSSLTDREREKPLIFKYSTWIWSDVANIWSWWWWWWTRNDSPWTWWFHLLKDQCSSDVKQTSVHPDFDRISNRQQKETLCSGLESVSLGTREERERETSSRLLIFTLIPI